MRAVRSLAFALLCALFVSPPVGAIEDRAYVAPPLMATLSLIASPPAPGTPAAERDLAGVLEAERARTPAGAAHVVKDAEPTFARFVGDLGWPAEKMPITSRLYANLLKTQGAISGPAKDCFLAPRPFVVDARVHPVAEIKTGSENTTKAPPMALPRGAPSPCRAAPEAPAAYSYSYPSGHAALGALAAIVLSRMVPEQREALFARGWDYGWNRVVAGVHFPSDIEASRLIATLIARELDKDPRFVADFAAAKAELRAGLGLSP